MGALLMSVVECEVHNIELAGEFIIDNLPDDALLAKVRMMPLEDHTEAVRELKMRHKISLSPDPKTGGFVPDTDAPPNEDLRFFPVTTARAEMSVRGFDAERDECWNQLDDELVPIRHILSFIYRRSVNFVRMRMADREAPTYNYQPNLIAGNHEEPLIVRLNQRRQFACDAVPIYRKVLSSSVSPAIRDALLHYLGHTREGLRIDERFLMLFIALEILANAHAQESGTENTLPEEVFSQFEQQMRECLKFLPDALAQYPDVNVQSTISMLRTKMRTDMKRNSIRQKIKTLAASLGLDSYRDLVGGWVDARNGFVHDGTIEALAVPVEERGNFWEDFVARLAGFLERALIDRLLGEHSPMLFCFSDSWEKDDQGVRWRTAEKWPSQ